MRFESLLPRRRANIVLAIALALAIAVAAAPTARANTTHWNNPSGGTFSDPVNWTSGVPGGSDTAAFDAINTNTFSVGFPGGTNLQPIDYATDRLLVNFVNEVSFYPQLAIGHPHFPSYTLNNPTTAEAGRALIVGYSNVNFPKLTTSLLNLNCAAATLGDVAKSAGEINVTAGALNITGSSAVDYELIVGNYGTGFLNITGGASVNLTGGPSDNLMVGNQPGSAGYITVDGAGSNLTGSTASGDRWVIGGSQYGSVLVSNGGHITNSQTYIGFQTGSVGDATVQGAGSVWTSQIILGAAAANGHGSLNIADGGTCVGNIIVGDAGELTSFSGMGTVNGNVTNYAGVFCGAHLGSVSVLHINGSYTQDSNGSLNITMGQTTPGTQFSQLQVSQAMSLAGSLFVSREAGFRPMPGQSFKILDWNTRSGTFSLVDLDVLGGRIAWDRSQLYTTGTISVLATYFAGDLNRDGHVDAADIPALMTALSDLNNYRLTNNLNNLFQFRLVADVNADGQVNNADTQVLINLLANGGGSGGGSLTAVPEPSALILAAVGGLILLALSAVDSIWQGLRNPHYRNQTDSRLPPALVAKRSPPAYHGPHVQRHSASRRH